MPRGWSRIIYSRCPESSLLEAGHTYMCNAQFSAMPVGLTDKSDVRVDSLDDRNGFLLSQRRDCRQSVEMRTDEAKTSITILPVGARDT